MEKTVKYLISYRSYCYQSGVEVYGYDIADDPIEWINSVQPLDETYILLNAQQVSDEQIKNYDIENFKGM